LDFRLRRLPPDCLRERLLRRFLETFFEPLDFRLRRLPPDCLRERLLRRFLEPFFELLDLRLRRLPPDCLRERLLARLEPLDLRLRRLLARLDPRLDFLLPLRREGRTFLGTSSSTFLERRLRRPPAWISAVVIGILYILLYFKKIFICYKIHF